MFGFRASLRGRFFIVGFASMHEAARLRLRGTAEAAVATWASASGDGRMRPSLRELLAFHRADVASVYSGFFGFQEAAQDFAGTRFRK